MNKGSQRALVELLLLGIQDIEDRRGLTPKLLGSISRYLSWEIYHRDVPVYIVWGSVFKLSSNVKHKPYQPIISIHQATGAYQYRIVGETLRTMIRTAMRHIHMSNNQLS